MVMEKRIDMKPFTHGPYRDITMNIRMDLKSGPTDLSISPEM